MKSFDLKKFISKWFVVEFLIFTFIIVFDLVTKHIVQSNMALGEEIVVIDGFFSFTYVKNTGAAFGVLSGNIGFFIALTVIVVPIMMFFTFYFRRFGRFFTCTMAVIISGALGNMIDRIALGFVRDFLQFTFFDFPVFNIADIALTCGAIALLVYLLFFCKELRIGKPKSEKASGEDSTAVVTDERKEAETCDAEVEIKQQEPLERNPENDDGETK